MLAVVSKVNYNMVKQPQGVGLPSFNSKKRFPRKNQFKKKPYIRRQRTVRNYWWLKRGWKRKKYYRFWQTRLINGGRKYRKRYWYGYNTTRIKPFTSRYRKSAIYRRWCEKFVKFPYRRRINALPGMPKYINYRQLFHNQILEKQTFRKLFRLTHKQLVKHFRKAVKSSKRSFDTNFIKYFELRLDTVVYRANLAFSYLMARQQVKKGFFKVNNRVMVRPNYTLNVGDCVTPVSSLMGFRYCLMRLFTRPLQVDQYPSYLMFNERVPVAMVVSNPDVNKIMHTLPVSWQFITFSMLKYKG